MRKLSTVVFVALLSVPFCGALGQQITVQEPSLEQFGVGTSVSVPDSGKGLAGSVRRRGSSRSRFGRLPAGSMGFVEQGGSFGVEVRVHDLEEKDLETRALAEKARKSQGQAALSPDAERAYAALKSRSTASGRSEESRSTASRSPQVASAKDKPREGPSVKKLLDRAHTAEAAGKRQLALSYLRVARDLGSADAKKELDRLTDKQ